MDFQLQLFDRCGLHHYIKNNPLSLEIAKSGIGILPVNAFEQQKHRLEAYATFGQTLKWLGVMYQLPGTFSDCVGGGVA